MEDLQDLHTLKTKEEALDSVQGSLVFIPLPI